VNRQDAGLAATGQGRPVAAARAVIPERGHTEPKRGAEWWGKSLLVTFGLLSKVTRCKSHAFQGLGLKSPKQPSQDDETMWEKVLERFEKQAPASVM
ncbi:hypothetical protein ACMV8S_30955, partial [Pseudomonas sp. S2.OTC.A_B10]